MKILTLWLRALLPTLAVSDQQLAEDLTLRGIAVEGVHPLGTGADGRPLGHLFEMDITTNRVDAMNHFGIAREAATIYDLPLPPLAASLPPPQSAAAPFPVRIDPAVRHLCGRFTARVLRGVRVGASEGEVRLRFDLLGQRPISNAVDASNHTLLAMGHPTHAFDLDRIDGEIVVRYASPGEPLRLLDGSERSLAAGDLVIADRRRALSLAGVMGGMDSSITAATRDVLVEAAWFDPATIRRSARRHGLHTDASHRFERGADFAVAPLANDLVAALILASGGGTVEGELIDLIVPEVESRTARRPAVTLAIREVQRQLGRTVDDRNGRSALTPELVERVLRALGCTLADAGTAAGANPSRTTLHTRQDTPAGEVLSVTLPSWRLDLERPVDLVEEVARVFGYNRFQNTLPAPLPVRAPPGAEAEARLRSRLLALGFSEAISSTFAGRNDNDLFAPDRHAAGAEAAPETVAVALENPLSEESADLRLSLLPGMLAMLALNLNRGVAAPRLFEQGHVFLGRLGAGDGTVLEEVAEPLRLSLGLTADAAAATPLHSAADAPLFALQGAIQAIASLFDLTVAASPARPSGTGGSPTASQTAGLRFTTGAAPAWAEPGRGATAVLHGVTIADFGELAAAESSRRKLREHLYLAEVDLAPLLLAGLRRPVARELSRFQTAERDFSFVFPDQTTFEAIRSAIVSLGLADLRLVRPVEIFRDARGTAVATGSYSLLLRTVFQSLSRTLTEEELTAASNRILAALTALGGVHRG